VSAPGPTRTSPAQLGQPAIRAMPGRLMRFVQVFREWLANLRCAMIPGQDGALGGTELRNAGATRPSPQGKGSPVDIIGVIIAGIIIGLLGKFVAPGDRDNIPLWLTVVCGIGGVLIGYYVAAALGVEATRGIDWIRWIISIIVAAVLVVIAASVTGRRGRTI
jgi:uncharacterized membrane protein YeaQ/YmgE (transglycosylase-associated protein family)